MRQNPTEETASLNPQSLIGQLIVSSAERRVPSLSLRLSPPFVHLGSREQTVGEAEKGEFLGSEDHGTRPGTVGITLGAMSSPLGWRALPPTWYEPPLLGGLAIDLPPRELTGKLPELSRTNDGSGSEYA